MHGLLRVQRNRGEDDERERERGGFHSSQRIIQPVSLRTRILLAFAAIVLIPIALLAFGVRQEMTRRLSNEYQARVNAVVEVIREDLMLEGDGISARLASLETALLNDTQFRLAITGLETGQAYLSNYARTAMGLTGLSLLQIQDGDGRILSSGPERDLLVVARTDSFSIGDQTFTLTGGIVVDEAFLARLARDREIDVSLRYPGERFRRHVRLKRGHYG